MTVRTTRNGWDQHNLIVFLDRCLHALQIFDIVLANEQIDEWTQVSGLMEQMRLNSWKLSRQIVQRVGNFCAADSHFTFSTCIGA